MKELDELLEWVWDQYVNTSLIVSKYRRYGDPLDEDCALSAEDRMDAYNHVMQQIKSMQKRGQK